MGNASFLEDIIEARRSLTTFYQACKTTDSVNLLYRRHEADIERLMRIAEEMEKSIVDNCPEGPELAALIRRELETERDNEELKAENQHLNEKSRKDEIKIRNLEKKVEELKGRLAFIERPRRP